MKIELYVDGVLIDSIKAEDYKHLTPAKIVAFLKNTHINKIIDNRWEIIMVVMSKMHKVGINDRQLNKAIEKANPKQVKPTVFVRPPAEYTNENYIDKYLKAS